MTLFETVFSGNDAVYGLTEGAINAAIEQHGADKAVSFPNTAYCLPCYYAVTGVKVKTLGELKEALGVVKTLMTREKISSPHPLTPHRKLTSNESLGFYQLLLISSKSPNGEEP